MGSLRQFDGVRRWRVHQMPRQQLHILRAAPETVFTAQNGRDSGDALRAPGKVIGGELELSPSALDRTLKPGRLRYPLVGTEAGTTRT
ncbi:hypothetical protein [Nocardia brevicatena]|uniref:hypothetical protein n=1 Tax=Nocardia brevicatena TaxID=37327 RepID=UPI0012FB3984|nr:hypothetical protein [Nocardia brevicatena]